MEPGRMNRVALRAACVDFLEDYKASLASPGNRMQIYPARPASIHPPTGFIDVLRDSIADVTFGWQRTPQAELVIIHALFDTKDAANQADIAVDGLLDWIFPRFHDAGANTTLGVRAVEDDPTYDPDWMPTPANGIRPVYFATRITLEGYSENV
jgi:hypothetical protein